MTTASVHQTASEVQDCDHVNEDGRKCSMAKTDSPYANSYQKYMAKGWKGVLPVKAMDKVLSDSAHGFTGYKNSNRYPEDANYHSWSHQGRANVALRMPQNVLGIDVDQYIKNGAQKRGIENLAVLEEELGELPASYRSSRRGPDNPSGIRFYRVPESENGWPGQVCGDVETVHHGHRYAVVQPSQVPDTDTGEILTYQWYTPDNIPMPGPPSINDLPLLPANWVRYLQKEHKRNGSVITSREDFPEHVEIPDDVDPSAPWYMKAMVPSGASGRGNNNLAAVTGGIVKMVQEAGLPYAVAQALILNYERASNSPQDDEVVVSMAQRFWAQDAARRREAGETLKDSSGNDVSDLFTGGSSRASGVTHFSKETNYLGVLDDEFAIVVEFKDDDGKTTKKTVPLTNYHFEPTRVIMTEEARKWRVNIFKGNGEVIGERIISSDDLSSEAKYTNWVRRFGGASYSGNKTYKHFLDTNMVTMWLDAFDLPELSEVSHIGWNPVFNEFVTPTGVIRPGISAMQPFDRCVPNELATDRSHAVYGFDVSVDEARELFRKWTTWHEPQVASVMASWVVMVALRGQYQEGELFPALLLEGLAESGKSKYTKVGLQLIGVDTDGGAWTPAAAENAYLTNGNGVVWWDDTTIDERVEEMARLAITGGSKNKMSAANGSKRGGGRFRAATVVSTEGATEKFDGQKANRDRYLKVKMTPIAARPSLTTPGKTQYEADVKPVKALYGDNFNRVAGSVIAGLLEHVGAIGEIEGSGRIAQNYGLLKAGARVLASYLGDDSFIGHVQEWIDSQEDLGNASSVLLVAIPAVWRHLGYPTGAGSNGMFFPVYLHEPTNQFRVHAQKLADVWATLDRNRTNRDRSLTDASGITTELSAIKAGQTAAVKISPGVDDESNTRPGLRYRTIPGEFTPVIKERAGVE